MPTLRPSASAALTLARSARPLCLPSLPTSEGVAVAVSADSLRPARTARRLALVTQPTKCPRAAQTAGGAAPKERPFGAPGTLSAATAEAPLLPTVKEDRDVGREARPALVRAADLEGCRCIVPPGTLLRPAPGGVRTARPLAAEAEGTITSYGHYANAVGEVGITGIPGAERQVLYANLADVQVLAARAVNR